MARTKQTAKPYEKGLITWTRFYLPRQREWPVWSVNHEDVHVGPLADVKGCRNPSLGRMVEDPEQAAYIIEWDTLDDFKNFRISPACAEFLRNLPARKGPKADVESGQALEHLSLGPASAPRSRISRFLILKHIKQDVTSNVEGRVTLTAFSIPRKIDDVRGVWDDKFSAAFGTFVPRGSEFMKSHRYFRHNLSAVWFSVLQEDGWVANKFGAPDQAQEHSHGRTVFCQFYVWRRKLDVTPEHEEASAADPQARESWQQAIAQVMPPATACEQERWDIQSVPRFLPPEPELDPEYPEYELEQRKALDEYLEMRGFRAGETSQTG